MEFRIVESLEQDALKYKTPEEFTQNAGIKAYHGTRKTFSKFDPKFRDLGFHFGSYNQALNRIHNEGEVKEFILDIKHPYDIVSDLGDWSDMEMLKEYLSEVNEGPFTDEEFSKFKNVDDVRKALEKLGYDGIIYENSFEGDNYEKSYIVFNSQQIYTKDQLIDIWKKAHNEIHST